MKEPIPEPITWDSTSEQIKARLGYLQRQCSARVWRCQRRAIRDSLVSAFMMAAGILLTNFGSSTSVTRWLIAVPIMAWGAYRRIRSREHFSDALSEEQTLRDRQARYVESHDRTLILEIGDAAISPADRLTDDKVIRGLSPVDEAAVDPGAGA